MFSPLFAKQILIYGGDGVGPRSLKHTKLALESLVEGKHKVKIVQAPQILEENWESSTALLVIPAGADLPYARDLNGRGNEKIRRYVEQGGSYLGICSGGYYGGSFVEFALGSALEVVGCRELAFFPGIVRGPTLAEYDYQSESGARTATLFWSGQPLKIYWNGGGSFVDAETFDQVKVLASYEQGEAAVVECQVGLGKAVLSGVHLECDPNLLDENDPFLQKQIPSLKEGNQGRLDFFKEILHTLGV